LVDGEAATSTSCCVEPLGVEPSIGFPLVHRSRLDAP
jgi:hypothetical protein